MSRIPRGGGPRTSAAFDGASPQLTAVGPSYESTLFARDADAVWIIGLTPAESFVASASPTTLVALVEAALGITE